MSSAARANVVECVQARAERRKHIEPVRGVRSTEAKHQSARGSNRRSESCGRHQVTHGIFPLAMDVSYRPPCHVHDPPTAPPASSALIGVRSCRLYLRMLASAGGYLDLTVLQLADGRSKLHQIAARNSSDEDIAGHMGPIDGGPDGQERRVGAAANSMFPLVLEHPRRAVFQHCRAAGRVVPASGAHCRP